MSEHADWWDTTLSRMWKHAGNALAVAGEPVTAVRLDKIFRSAPSYSEEVWDTQWQESSFLLHCLDEGIRQRESSPLWDKVELLEDSGDFWLREYIMFPPVIRQLLMNTVLGKIQRVMEGEFIDDLLVFVELKSDYQTEPG